MTMVRTRPRFSDSRFVLLNSTQGLELPSYILSALTAAGGVAGYARTKSKPSIIAGTAVGLLCTSTAPVLSQCLWTPRRPETWQCAGANPIVTPDGLGGYRIANNEPYGVELSLLASLVLGGSAFPRAIRLRKPVPIMLSLLATYGLVTFGDAFRRAL